MPMQSMVNIQPRPNEITQYNKGNTRITQNSKSNYSRIIVQ